MPAREISLPNGGRGWLTGRGRLGLWTPTPDVLVLLFEGHGEGEWADRAIEALDRMIASSDQIRMFFYMPAMVAYDSKLRTALTARILQDRKRVVAIHTLTGSKIVAMGVTMANIALRNITAHTDASSFMSALRAVTQGKLTLASFASPE